MKFVKSSIEYGYKNFFRLIFFILPISFFYVFILSPLKIPKFLSEIKDVPMENFGDFIDGVLDFSYLNIIYILVLVFASAIIFSFLTSAIEFHLRTGRFKFRKNISISKQYLFPTLVVFCILIVFNLFFLYICSAIGYFIYIATGSLGTIISSTGYIIILSSYALIQLLFITIAAFLFACINPMVLNGTTFGGAISFTLHMFEGRFLKFLLAIISGHIVLNAIYFLAGDFKYINYVYSIVYAAFVLFIVVLNIISFFSLNKIERKDLIKYPFNF